jgi:hypothetical protein
MNNTTNNQGDHCIFPFNAFAVANNPDVFEGNQVLDATLCRPRNPQV